MAPRCLVWRHLLCGLLLYGLISLVLLKSFGQQLNYVTTFFKPDKFTAQPAVVLQRSLQQAWGLYSGAASTFLGFSFFYRVLSLLCLAILIWTIVSQWKGTKGGTSLFAGLLAGIAVAPFLQHPLNHGNMPLRALVGLPAAVAILALFAVEASPQRLRRYVILPLAGLVILEFSAINNKLYHAGHWALERDKVLGTQIISRI